MIGLEDPAVVHAVAEWVRDTAVQFSLEVMESHIVDINLTSNHYCVIHCVGRNT